MVSNFVNGKIRSRNDGKWGLRWEKKLCSLCGAKPLTNRRTRTEIVI